jgi:hypothetical protein
MDNLLADTALTSKESKSDRVGTFASQAPSFNTVEELKPYEEEEEEELDSSTVFFSNLYVVS